MKWEKSPEWLVQAFDKALPDDARVERKQMFGYPCAFALGQMFTGLHQSNLIVRLPPEDREEARRQGGTSFEPMPGRAMKEYVALAEPALRDPEALQGWMQRALEFALSLGPKEKKPRKKS